MILFASWYGCEAGTTRHSPAADVPRFRASKPPFFSQRLAWQMRPRPFEAATIAPSRERPELAWGVRIAAARRMSGSAASDRITPAVGAMPPVIINDNVAVRNQFPLKRAAIFA
jgi:hypothetical protein